MTHDSIGLGEDGPTHQPVEHLAALRAMPNLQVFRPADAVETAECWELALRSRQAPSVLALTRQALPALAPRRRREPLGARRLCAGRGRGHAPGDAHRHRLGSGAGAGGARAARGATTSPPRWSRCRAGSCSTRRTRAIAPRCSAPRRASRSRRPRPSAGSAMSAPAARSIGMTGFGASAPAEDLFRHFGITAEAVADAVAQRLP